MAQAEPAERPISSEREWWLRTLLVLQSPTAVFAALRDDSDEAAAARQEPMVAVVYLAGIAAFLATPTAAHLFDDVEYDSLLVVVETLFAGALVGIQNYWLGGGALYLAARGLGATGSYRRARHLLGLAMTPLVISLLTVWPVAIAVYRSDLFRSGGADAGAGRWVFQGLWLASVIWGFALLLIGMRVVHGWTWSRSLAAVAVAALVLVGVALAVSVA